MDAKEGFGVLQYKNGEVYEGMWQGNFAHGTITYITIFLSILLRLLVTGPGTLTYADGDKYVGEWRAGKKSGPGELFYVNGDKFR